MRDELSPLFPRVLVTTRRSKVSSLLPLPAAPLFRLGHLTRATRICVAAHATRHASEHCEDCSRVFPQSRRATAEAHGTTPLAVAAFAHLFTRSLQHQLRLSKHTFQTVFPNNSRSLRGHLRRGARRYEDRARTQGGARRHCDQGIARLWRRARSAHTLSEACEALAVPAPQGVLGQF